MFLDIISYFVSQFEGFCCSYVSRKGNVLGHRVARWDPRPGNEKIFMNSFPQVLLALANVIQ